MNALAEYRDLVTLEAVLEEKRNDLLGLGVQRTIELAQIVVGVGEGDRPQGHVGLDLALGQPLDGDDTIELFDPQRAVAQHDSQQHESGTDAETQDQGPAHALLVHGEAPG